MKKFFLGLALSTLVGSVFAANVASLQISPIGSVTSLMVTQGTSNVLMRTFQAKFITSRGADRGPGVRITSLTVNRSLLSSDSDLSSVKLYLKGVNNFILLGACTLVNSTCTYNNLNVVVPSGTPQNFVLKADVSANAGHNKVVVLRVTNMNAFDIQTSSTVQVSGLPITSSTLLIQ